MYQCTTTKREVFITDELSGVTVSVPTIVIAARLLGCQPQDIYYYVVGKGNRPGFLKKRKITIELRVVGQITFC